MAEHVTQRRGAGAALVLAVGCAVALSAPAVAQAPGFEPPRTADGKPDLQGIWTNASLTTLERSSQFDSLVIPEEAAVRIAAQRAAGLAADSAPTDPSAPPPAAGRSVGGYNAFWVDGGSAFARIGGEHRSSWIVDPADGRLPYSEEGRATFETKLRHARETYTDPEARPLAERCLIGYGSTAGPPMLNVGYNNFYQIVQTPDHVMILVEMNHDARIIPLGGEPDADAPPRWMGHSAGRWEGDALVVETTNLHPLESLRTYFDQSFYISPDARITERFTRVSDDEILYEFAVDDPATFTQTWRAEMPLRATSEHLYEYACHEGNHALPGILAGARREERRTETDVTGAGD